MTAAHRISTPDASRGEPTEGDADGGMRASDAETMHDAQHRPSPSIRSVAEERKREKLVEHTEAAVRRGERERGCKPRDIYQGRAASSRPWCQAGEG